MNFKLWFRLVLLGGLLSLSGCWIDSGDSPQSVSAFAARDVNVATCDNGAPREINAVNLTADNAQTDVNALTPACKPLAP